VVRIDTLKQRAKELKRETLALYLAIRNPKTPWYAKAFVAVVVAYAFSPIDLIPDFIPVIGYLDDLFLLPFGIVLAIRMIPESVLAEARCRAAELLSGGRPVSWLSASIIVLLWLLIAVLFGKWLYDLFLD